jgi:hypothetical protein
MMHADKVSDDACRQGIQRHTQIRHPMMHVMMHIMIDVVINGKMMYCWVAAIKKRGVGQRRLVNASNVFIGH